MSIIYNGKTITNPTYNGVSLGKVIYSGVTVFQRELYLYNNGSTGYSFSLVRHNNDDVSTLSNAGSYLELYSMGAQPMQIHLNTKIDVTGFNKIIMQCNLPEYNRTQYLRYAVGIAASNTSYGVYSDPIYLPAMVTYTMSQNFTSADSTMRTLTCDISAYSGNYYPAIFKLDRSNSSGRSRLRIYKIYLSQ